MMLRAPCLLAALSAVGALFESTVQITPEEFNEAQIREHVAKLQQNVHFDLRNLPYERTEHTETSCPTLFMFTPCRAITFVNEKSMIPYRKAREDDPPEARDFNGRFVRDEKNWTSSTVFVRRVVLKRVKNIGSNPAVMTREKSTVTIDSTTSGWTVGAQLSGGYFDLKGDQGANFVQVGLSISGSYSSHETHGTQVSLSELSSMTCAPMHNCRSELWTTYVRISGVCRSNPKFSCGYEFIDPCPISFSICNQLESWQSKVCKVEERFKECEITVPVTERGGNPYVVEVFLEEPMRVLSEMPRITGYKSGFYLLGSENYRYDPDAKTDPYWTPDRGWHSNDIFPTLDTSVFQHKVPKIIEHQGPFYRLDTEEWYNPGGGNYYTEGKGWYAKPGAPPPSAEDIARFVDKDVDIQPSSSRFVEAAASSTAA